VTERRCEASCQYGKVVDCPREEYCQESKECEFRDSQEYRIGVLRFVYIGLLVSGVWLSVSPMLGKRCVMLKH